jgi:exopolysaccharide biosynthesis predicted pyruvyltransferase EpsI
LVSGDNDARAMQGFLEELRGCRVFLPHNPGNLGDRLIAMGSAYAIEKAGVRLVVDPRRADWLFIQGGGGMNEYWGTQFARFLGMSERWPEKPLAILPSTFRFTTDLFAATLRSRRSMTRLFARDRASFEWLRDFSGHTVHPELADDAAFALADSPFVAQLRERRERAGQTHILVVERSDGEHHDSTASLTRRIEPVVPDVRWRAAAKGRLRPWRETLRRRRYRRRVAPWSVPASATLLDETRAHARRLGLDPSLPIKAGDVADNYIYSFDEFVGAVLSSALVVTTRLHVGILAALAGVPTALRDGRYGKLRGAYELSMSHMPHVSLIEVP